MSVPPFLPWAGSLRLAVALPANSCSVGLSDSDWAGVPDEDDEPSSPPPQPAMAIAAAQAARNGKRLIDPR